MNFDAKNPLIMNTRRTVLGHALNRGVALTVVDKPSAPGEVDQQTAELLFKKKIATTSEDFRPTAEAPISEDEAKLTSPRKKTSGSHKPSDKPTEAAAGQTSAASGSNDHATDKSKSGSDPEKKKTD